MEKTHISLSTKARSVTLHVLLGFLAKCDITLEGDVTLLLLHILCFVTVDYIVSAFLVYYSRLRM